MPLARDRPSQLAQLIRQPTQCLIGVLPGAAQVSLPLGCQICGLREGRVA
jgi:hypothetical protein